MVQGNMDPVAAQVEVMKGVCKLSSHGTLGQKGGMPECRNPGKRVEGDSWHLSPFDIFPVFEKGTMSVEEQHRGGMGG